MKTEKIFEEAYKNRVVSDYHDFVFLSKQQVEEFYIDMKKFVFEVDKLIQTKIESYED